MTIESGLTDLAREWRDHATDASVVDARDALTFMASERFGLQRFG